MKARPIGITILAFLFALNVAVYAVFALLGFSTTVRWLRCYTRLAHPALVRKRSTVPWGACSRYTIQAWRFLPVP